MICWECDWNHIFPALVINLNTFKSPLNEDYQIGSSWDSSGCGDRAPLPPRGSVSLLHLTSPKQPQCSFSDQNKFLKLCSTKRSHIYTWEESPASGQVSQAAVLICNKIDLSTTKFVIVAGKKLKYKSRKVFSVKIYFHYKSTIDVLSIFRRKQWNYWV